MVAILTDPPLLMEVAKSARKSTGPSKAVEGLNLPHVQVQSVSPKHAHSPFRLTDVTKQKQSTSGLSAASCLETTTSTSFILPLAGFGFHAGCGAGPFIP